MSVVSLSASEIPDQRKLGPLLWSLVLAYLLTLIALVSAGLAWGEKGYDMLVVAMGWPHVFLGFLFYFNKVVKGQVPHRTYFWFLISLTVVICALHTITPMTTFIYVYFVFHALRDEIFIYHQRRTGFRYRGPLFNLTGAGFLGVVLVVASLNQVSWRTVLRSVDIPLQALRSDQDYTIPFEPVKGSAGSDFYFSVTAVKTEGLRTVRTSAISRRLTDGELFIAGKQRKNEDLAFQALYQGVKSGPSPKGKMQHPLLVTGGHEIGQTFRAQHNGLDGIALPLEVDLPVGSSSSLRFRLESAFQMRHPFVEEGLLLLALLVLCLFSILGSPARYFARYPETRYFAPVLILFVAVQFLFEAGRYYSLTVPLLFSFLVVFHYFSWYVFSLEQISERVRIGAPGQENLLDRVLRRISSREGFLGCVVGLHVISLGGVLSYYLFYPDSFLRYLFDLQYFLYFLVFHVTMSFAPKKARREV